MRRIATLFVGLALASGGCLSTCHIEHQREIYSGTDPSGAPVQADSTVHSERSWFGPWLGLPSQAIP